MRLLCHDERCRGHNERAGATPEATCRFCGLALMNGSGECIVTQDDPPAVSWIAFRLCEYVGHAWDGFYRDGELYGSCARCGSSIRLVD